MPSFLRSPDLAKPLLPAHPHTSGLSPSGHGRRPGRGTLALQEARCREARGTLPGVAAAQLCPRALGKRPDVSGPRLLLREAGTMDSPPDKVTMRVTRTDAPSTASRDRLRAHWGSVATVLAGRVLFFPVWHRPGCCRGRGVSVVPREILSLAGRTPEAARGADSPNKPTGKKDQPGQHLAWLT